MNGLSRRKAGGLIASAAAIGPSRLATAKSRTETFPEVFFIQSQLCPWTPAPEWGAGAKRRLLRVGREGVGLSYVLRMPPGFRQGMTKTKTGILYLVDGDLSFKSTGYRRHEFANFRFGPGGGVGLRSDQGASALVVEVEAQHSDPLVSESLNGFQSITTWSIDWSDQIDFDWPLRLEGATTYEDQPGRPSRPALARAFWKMLPRMTDTPGHTALWSGIPGTQDQEALSFSPTSNTEVFLLQGSLVDDHIGTMTPGAYAALKPGKQYGPWSTDTGFLALVRAHGDLGMRRTNVQSPSSRGRELLIDRVPSHLKSYAKRIDLKDWWSESLS